jgi:hypothetical protein
MSSPVYSLALDLPKTVLCLAPIADKFATTLIKKFVPSLNLPTHTAKFLSNRDRALFQTLIDPVELLQILKASPSELKQYALKYSKFSKTSKLKLLKAFNYKGFRSSPFAFEFVKSLGIKTCMHCNTAFTLAIDNDATPNPKIVFELDHFYPKSEYPYLSLSFFNLIPCCGNCNRLIATMSKAHHPFEVSLDDLFSVSVSNANLAECIANPSTLPELVTLQKVDDYKPVFDKLRLADRYAHFSDIAQEIIWKSCVYTEEYTSFVETILEKKDLVHRAIWGNYCTPDDYHKRPLSKFTTDICRQLKVF